MACALKKSTQIWSCLTIVTHGFIGMAMDDLTLRMHDCIYNVMCRSCANYTSGSESDGELWFCKFCAERTLKKTCTESHHHYRHPSTDIPALSEVMLCAKYSSLYCIFCLQTDDFVKVTESSAESFPYDGIYTVLLHYSCLYIHNVVPIDNSLR